MSKTRTVGATLALALLLGCGADNSAQVETTTDTAPAGPTADQVLADVVAAMGTADLNSITLSGRAWNARNGWMQTLTADPPWSWRNEVTNYQHTIDLNAGASRATGETMQSDIFLNPPVAGTYNQNIAAGAPWSQQLEVWLTPYGFLRGAENNGVELSDGKLDGVEYRVLSWMSPESTTSPSGMRYTVNAYINDDDMIAGVETWVEDNFMGDFHIVQVYDNYRELDGVMVPQSIEQLRGGGGLSGAYISAADANPANLNELMTPPQAGGGGRFGGPGRRGGGPGGGGAPAEPDPMDMVVDLGGGAYLITVAYQALAVEFEDHVKVFEAGMAESVGEDIIAAVTAAIPDKPLTHIINSHPHSDHTGGIVPLIRHGATLVTHQNNAAFLDMALNTPRTLLGQDDLNANVEGVSGVHVYEDSMNRLELHSVPNMHTDGMLVAVLPNQGVMFQADFTLPAEGAEANPFVRTLAQYVADNDVQFEQYIAVHAAAVPQTRDDLLAALD